MQKIEFYDLKKNILIIIIPHDIFYNLNLNLQFCRIKGL